MIRVRWEIDVDAETWEEAALKALVIMRDPDSRSIVFGMRNKRGERIEIDLMECAVCDNCEHVFQVAEDNDFAVIPNLNERITPGNMVPACECPKCGALAYPAARTRGAR
jgi:hypothetical protein